MSTLKGNESGTKLGDGVEQEVDYCGFVNHCVGCEIASTEVCDESEADYVWFRDDMDWHGIHVW